MTEYFNLGLRLPDLILLTLSSSIVIFLCPNADLQRRSHRCAGKNTIAECITCCDPKWDGTRTLKIKDDNNKVQQIEQCKRDSGCAYLGP